MPVGDHIRAVGPRFRMTIGADPGEVSRVSAAFGEFADAHALPAPMRRSVTVALDELLSNTIAYGFTRPGDGEVTVDVELRADRLCVTLTDDGAPFDPLSMTPPPTPPTPWRSGRSAGSASTWSGR